MSTACERGHKMTSKLCHAACSVCGHDCCAHGEGRCISHGGNGPCDCRIFEDPPEAVLVEGDATACDGAGWYYYDGEYPDEGVVGAFKTSEEARAHASEAGYVVRDNSGGRMKFRKRMTKPRSAEAIGLQELRKSRDLSLKAAAARIGVSAAVLAELERGTLEPEGGSAGWVALADALKMEEKT